MNRVFSLECWGKRNWNCQSKPFPYLHRTCSMERRGELRSLYTIAGTAINFTDARPKVVCLQRNFNLQEFSSFLLTRKISLHQRLVQLSSTCLVIQAKAKRGDESTWARSKKQSLRVFPMRRSTTTSRISFAPRLHNFSIFSLWIIYLFVTLNCALVIASIAGNTNFSAREKNERNRFVPIGLMAKHYWFIIGVLLLIRQNIYLLGAM